MTTWAGGAQAPKRWAILLMATLLAVPPRVDCSLPLPIGRERQRERVAPVVHRVAPMPLLAFLLLTACAAGARAAPVFDEPQPLSSTASVVVERSSGAVFTALADPLAWPTLLSDVERVERDRDDARSWRVVSKLLGHAHVLELTVERDRLVHFHVTDPGPGGSLVVDIRFEPVTAERTRVRYSMKTVLPLGLDRVVDDDFVRRARDKKIASDLTDIERRFGASREQASDRPPRP